MDNTDKAKAAIIDATAKKLDLIYERNRLKTFTIWPFDNGHHCSAKKMAEAGFYYVGTEDEPDAVQCFLCGKTLDGWDADDNPWKEHLSHSPNCGFAQLEQPEEAMMPQQLLDFHKQLTSQEYVKARAELSALLQREFVTKYNEKMKILKSFTK